MPDTGAPWNIPYVAPSDLVRDYPSDSEDLAEAIADGLDAAGGLVAVKHALFTGTQTNSTAGGANFAVTDLSITHTLASATNRLIISAYFGIVSSSSQAASVGLAVADDGTLLALGDASGSKARVASGSRVPAFSNQNQSSTSLSFVYEPGDAVAHTYTVRAININDGTSTIYINRSEATTDDERFARGSSGLVIQEVRV
jgi:hypothetical protein